jgi:hypothetical protein
VARSSAYGLTLKSPDATRWTLSALQAGVVPVIALDDTANKDEGICVTVLNPLLAYGPPALDYVGAQAKPERRRAAMRGGVRGGLIGFPAQIDSEKFRKYRELDAFEALATPRIPGMKIKLVGIDRPSGFVMVLMMGTPEHIAEYEKLVENGLSFDEK